VNTRMSSRGCRTHSSMATNSTSASAPTASSSSCPVGWSSPRLEACEDGEGRRGQLPPRGPGSRPRSNRARRPHRQLRQDHGREPVRRSSREIGALIRKTRRQLRLLGEDARRAGGSPAGARMIPSPYTVIARPIFAGGGHPNHHRGADDRQEPRRARACSTRNATRLHSPSAKPAQRRGQAEDRQAHDVHPAQSEAVAQPRRSAEPRRPSPSR